MKHNKFIEQRACDAANLLIEENTNIRKVAKKLGVSKSTTHIDLTVRLKEIDYNLFLQAREIISKNKEERAMRGGTSTKKLYRDIKHINQ